MSLARAFCGAATIGNSMYVVGGRNGDGLSNPMPVSSVEAFTMQYGSGAWATMTPSFFSQSDYSMAATATKLYTIGGITNNYSPNTTTGEFDPAKGTRGAWTCLPAPVISNVSAQSGRPAATVGNAIYCLFSGGGNPATYALAKYTLPILYYCFTKN